MRSCAIEVFLLALSFCSHAAAQEIRCECPVPPGGSTTCQPNQIAICKVRSNQCEGKCVDWQAETASDELADYLRPEIPDKEVFVATLYEDPDTAARNLYAIMEPDGSYRITLNFPAGARGVLERVVSKLNQFEVRPSRDIRTAELAEGPRLPQPYYSTVGEVQNLASADFAVGQPDWTALTSVMKRGENDFSGAYYFGWQDESFVLKNVDDDLRQRGFTGNPQLFSRELHADLGGRIVRDHAWFYGFYENSRVDKQISPYDPSEVIDKVTSHSFGARITATPTRKDTFSGLARWQVVDRPNWGLSAVTPQESTLSQQTWAAAYQLRWDRAWNDRVFSSLHTRLLESEQTMVPKVSPGPQPARTDRATGRNSGAGFVRESPPFTAMRSRPELRTTFSYYLPRKGGDHQFDFGYHFWIDRSLIAANSSSGVVRYFDNSNLGRPKDVDEIALYNLPSTGEIRPDNRDMHHDFFAQDTWTLNGRITVNLGLRFGHQRSYYLDAELRPLLLDFFPAGIVRGRTLVTWNNWAPRLGLTLDVTGKARSILTASLGRFYDNTANAFSFSNPSAVAFQRFKFLDQNQNGLFDGSHELGELVSQTGTVGSALDEATGTAVNSALQSAFTDQFVASLEHDLTTRISLRLSYARDNYRNDYGQWNRAQQLPLFEGQAILCGDAVFPCPTDPITGKAQSVVRVPEQYSNAQDQVIDAFPGSDYNYDTVLIRVRWSPPSFLVLAQFQHKWRDELRSAKDEDQSPHSFDPLEIGSAGHRTIFQNHSQNVPFRQRTTSWEGTLSARYVLPKGITVGAIVQHRSGWPWAPILVVDIPGSGTQPVFLSNLSEQRSENVTSVDLTVEKNFSIAAIGALTAALDIQNLLNSNRVTNFDLRSGGDLGSIIAAQEPLSFMVSVRFTF